MEGRQWRHATQAANETTTKIETIQFERWDFYEILMK